MDHSSAGCNPRCSKQASENNHGGTSRDDGKIDNNVFVCGQQEQQRREGSQSFKLSQKWCSRVCGKRYAAQEYRCSKLPIVNNGLETNFTQTCEPWDRNTCVSKFISKVKKCNGSLKPEKVLLASFSLAPNDGYDRIREFKDRTDRSAGNSTICKYDGCEVREAMRDRVLADMASQVNPICHKIVMCGSPKDQSSSFEKKPSIGTQNSRVKKSSTGGPVKKINKRIKTRARDTAGKKTTSAVSSSTSSKKRIVKKKKYTSDPCETWAPQSSTSNSSKRQNSSYSAPRKTKPKQSSVAKSKSKKILEKPAELQVIERGKPDTNMASESVLSDDDDSTTPRNEKSTTSTIRTVDEDPQSRLLSNRQIIERLEPGMKLVSPRRKVPKSSVMTIWHWLRNRSSYTPKTTKESSSPERSNHHRVQDPFLSLFFPAMIASDFPGTRIIRGESKKRKSRW